MPPLSFFEFLQIRGRGLPNAPRDLRPQDLFQKGKPFLAHLAEGFRGTLPEFQRYLMVGGFPETALSDETDYCQRILREDVVERVLKRDMVALFGVRKINELEKLFIYLCLNTGGVLSIKTVATELGTTAATLDGYLDLLESSHLIFRLSPTDVGGKKVLRQQNKYYLADAALRNAVLLKGPEILSDSEELGKVVETSVLRHLYAYHYLDSPRIVYWREPRTSKEVDVIIRSPRYHLLREGLQGPICLPGDPGGQGLRCNRTQGTVGKGPEDPRPHLHLPPWPGRTFSLGTGRPEERKVGATGLGHNRATVSL
jgi:predicted AAA+ superfamily ATPase